MDLAGLGERACEVVETATGAVVTDAGTDAARAALAGHAVLVADLADVEETLLGGDGDYWQGQVLEHCRRTADHGATIARLALRGALRRGDLEVAPVLGDTTLAGPLENGGLDGTAAAGDPTDGLDPIDGEATEDGVNAEGPDATLDADG